MSIVLQIKLKFQPYMRIMKRKYVVWLLMAVMAISASGLSSCGTLHSYWGVENDYVYDFDDYGHKHKHKKHKKHKKHHKHHHHH